MVNKTLKEKGNLLDYAGSLPPDRELAAKVEGFWKKEEPGSSESHGTIGFPVCF